MDDPKYHVPFKVGRWALVLTEKLGWAQCVGARTVLQSDGDSPDEAYDHWKDRGLCVASENGTYRQTRLLPGQFGCCYGLDEHVDGCEGG